MTKYVFHGDNHAASRHELQDAIAKEKKDDNNVQYIDGLKISPKDLETALTSVNLFGTESLVIENLGSRPLSNDKKKAIEFIKNYTGEKNIFLWEKKELTKTQVNAFGNDVIARVAKVPAVIFKFLDVLEPGRAKNALELLHDTLKTADEGFVFVMLSRQISDLIIAKSGDTQKLIPFKRSRLISQTRAFSDLQLSTVHFRLLEIDRKIKTGQTKLNYADHLDLLLAQELN